ncbi:hypothetical protein ACIO52_02960 [Nocardia sp. NPDC087230]|uniref:hypothetical protein n=1 Tax=Nocardia sp. NPDC087230 TaxID=3364331 RepID=UPI003823B818
MSSAEDDPDVAQAREFLEMLTVEAAGIETAAALATSPQQRAAHLSNLRRVRGFIDALHRRFPDLTDR